MKTTTQGQPVGKAFIVYGTVKAISPGGFERVLHPNSPIFADDRIVTGSDGSISIHFINGTTSLDLGRMADVVVDEDVYTGYPQQGESTAEIADIQATMVQDPNFDPTTGLPAPGAGDTGEGLRGGGRQIVVITPDQAEVTPDSGAETIGVAHNFLDPPPVDILLQEEGQRADQVSSTSPELSPSAPLASIIEPPDELPAPPPADDTIPTIGTVDRSLDEANLADGTNPNTSALTTNGTLTDLGVSFGNNTPGMLDFGDGNVIVIDHIGNDSIIVPGQYGNLIVHDDGSWHYTLGDNTLQHTASGATGQADQVTDQFSFSVVGASGSTATGGQVNVHILDDGPELTAGNVTVDETGGLDSNVPGPLSFSYGADGPGSFSLAAEGASWNGGSQILAANDGSWQLVVNPTGGYSFTQLQPMDHPVTTDPNDALTINVTATVTDGDNDSLSQGFTVTVLDDGPELTAGNVTVDETGGLDSNVPGPLSFSYGADGPGSFSLAAEGASWNEGSQILAANDGSWQLVVNPTGGYSFTQLQPLDHPVTTDPNDALTINVTATVTDGDNDSLSQGFTVTVLDDGPELTAGNVTVDETGGLDSNVPGPLSFSYGADGPGSFSLAAEGASWNGGSQILAANDGSWQLVVNPTGGYSFTQLQPLDHPVTTDPNDALTINVTATVTDGDNDSLSQGFTVTVLDDGPVAGNPYNAILANQPGNTATGDLRADFNEDGPSANPSIPAVQLSGQIASGQYLIDNEGELITSNGEQLVYQDDGNGGLIAVTSTSNNVVFSIDVNVDDAGHASYTVTLDDTNPLDTVSKDEMILTYDAVITDGDGDTDTTSFDVSFVHIENPAGMTQLTGTTEDEVIAGSSGNDYIDGKGGSDIINADSGNDIIITGSGNDTIDAGSGNDTVVSNGGNDTITGGSGNDIVFSGDGDDTVVAGDDNDSVNGGNGNDTISGGSGNDTLQGDADNDTLVGGAGADVMNGGEGDDTLFAGEETSGDGQDQVTSGSGADTYVDVNNDVDTAGGDIAVDSMGSGDQNMDELVPPPEPV